MRNRIKLPSVPLRLLAGFPIAFLDYIESGDWHLFAMDFDTDKVHALAMWIDNPNGPDFPAFIANASILDGNATVLAALRRLADDALDTEAERIAYMRLPVAA